MSSPQAVFETKPSRSEARYEKKHVALAIANDDQWAALVDFLGRPDWATKEAYATEAGRRADETWDVAGLVRHVRRSRAPRRPLPPHRRFTPLAWVLTTPATAHIPVCYLLTKPGIDIDCPVTIALPAASFGEITLKTCSRSFLQGRLPCGSSDC